MADETKPDVDGPEVINLKVVTQDGAEVHFKCKKNTALGKLMNAFCTRQGVPMGALRFLFDGERIKENETPAQLDMDEGDSIDVFNEQLGGF